MPKLVCGLVDHVIDDAFVEFRRSGQLDLGGLKPFGLLLRGFGATADQTTFQFFEGRRLNEHGKHFEAEFLRAPFDRPGSL